MKSFITMTVAMVLAFSLVACSTNTVNTDNPGESAEQTHPANNAEYHIPTESKTPFDEPNNQEPPRTAKERLGFTGGNIGAGGLVCGGDDGYIYYRENDSWKLYRAKPDGSEKMRISDNVPDVINVLDGWVYFKAYTDFFAIYRVRTDGTDETKLADGGYGNLFVAESGMYYETRDDSNMSHIYRADLDGGNATLLFSDASLMYYYCGKIYIGAAMLGVFDIETGEERVLDDTYIHNVTVDESGIYYWAFEEGEFRRMDHDGSNRSVILHGGDFFNYTDGRLYYMGISENTNGHCYVINCLNLETGETETLYEALNEFFNEQGNLIGITINQYSSGDYAPDIFEYNSKGEEFLKSGGWKNIEQVGYVYIAGEHIFMPQAVLRECLFQKGRLDCIARLDGGMMFWD